MDIRTGADITAAEGKRTSVKLLRLGGVLMLVNGVLLAPWWVLTGGLTTPWVALEAVVIVGAFSMLPRKPWAPYAASAVALLVAFFTIIGFGDTTLRLSLGRPLNLYLDVWLLSSARALLVGGLGPVLAVLALALLSAGIALLTGLLGWLLTSIRVESRVLSARLTGLGIVVFVGAGLTAERVPVLAPHVDAPTVRLVRDQIRRFVAIINEREWFAEALSVSADSYAALPGLLSRLEGRDVIFAFIESYGVTALYDPRYSPVVGPRLDDFQARMDAAGLYVVSGKLVQPSQGGQSWFGHGSVLSGVWLDNQLRYDMLLSSGRETLIDDFRRAGYRTVAVMPAITRAWPEGERFGYDEIFAAPHIGYAGPPLNWVTMPDQFVWSFLENSIRGVDDRPLFAELGLISSHAPWTPILPVLDDWDAIGDGAIFAQFEDTGVRPEDLWREADRIREHYAMSVEYAVHAMAAYAERYVDDRTLLIVLGDHQPAPLITGEGATWDVPVHVISGDRALLEPFIDWGFSEGAWPNPDPERETLGVDYFRDWFIRAYSGS